MTPVLLDTSICAEAIGLRPDRLIRHFEDNHGSMHITPVTAASLYQAARLTLGPDSLEDAFGQIDRFISQMDWVDGDFATVRLSSMYEMDSKTSISFQTAFNLRLAKASGLIYVASQEIASDVPQALPGFDIAFW